MVAYLSFDIGIKHMAFCVLEPTPTEGLVIHAWEVVSLMTPIECPFVPPPCQGLSKQKTTCNKVAIYEHGTKTMCRVHAKQQGNLLYLPSKERSSVHLRRQGASAIETLYKEVYPAGTATKKQDRIEALVIHYERTTWKLITQPTLQRADEADLVTLGRNMMQVLDARHVTNGITTVLIENQISTLATRMKTIQGMVAQYCIMRNADMHIEFVSSSNKLKFLPLSLFPNGLEKGYSENKKNGILACDTLLRKNPSLSTQWLTWWEQWDKTKKDDLADCFLQGLAYLKNKDRIEYNTDHVISTIA